MGREPRQDLLGRLRYRAAHPVQTFALLVGLGCICMAIGAVSPAHSADRTRPRHADAKRKAHKAAPVGTQLRGVNLSPNRAFMPAPFGTAADDEREIASACQLGAGVVREFVSWGLLEKGHGQINPDYLARLDSLMDQAARCRIKVIFTLLGTPSWDTQGPDPADVRSSTYPPQDGSNEFGWMVSWILNRWPGLYALEVWNEPNLSSFWKGTPGQYAQLVNAAVAAKRDTGARTLILGGTLALGAPDYLRQLYAAGMRGQDGISLHPYSMSCAEHCGSAQFLDPGSRRGPFRSAILNVHRAMAENGDSGGLWLTEFGMSTCPAQPACVPDDVQASWMAKSIRIASCYPYVAGLTAFTLRDIPVPPDDPGASYWDYHFGLMGSDFTPKPAFSAVRNTFSRLGQAHAAVARKASRASKRVERASTGQATGMCRRILGTARVSKAGARRG
jgi:glycosyl hydrolase family 39 (putative alpha-L-iduronidase)